MTEVWKSTPKFFCELCKVWMQDNPHSRGVHEQGIKHKEAVAKKLSDMRKAAVTQKTQEAEAAATMDKIEAQARQQYEADLKAAAELKKQTLGEWVFNLEAGYYYNAVQRYYYDTKTSMYYGGEPVVWTSHPAIPHEARYEVMNKPLPPPKQPPPAAAVAAAAARPAAAAAVARPVAAAAAAAGGARVGQRIAVQHPHASVGGYQMPDMGRIGGAKGVGSTSAASASAASAGGGDSAKRKREGEGGKGKGGGKPLNKEEQEALARREAARQRVQQRTMATFGLQ